MLIIAVGFWLSNLAHDAVRRVSGPEGGPVANIARSAILGLVLAMGLRAMGLADAIVTLAFGLTLGAVAVAVALSFGLAPVARQRGARCSTGSPGCAGVTGAHRSRLAAPVRGGRPGPADMGFIK